jgi:hypothetical protein
LLNSGRFLLRVFPHKTHWGRRGGAEHSDETLVCEPGVPMSAAHIAVTEEALDVPFLYAAT